MPGAPWRLLEAWDPGRGQPARCRLRWSQRGAQPPSHRGSQPQTRDVAVLPPAAGVGATSCQPWRGGADLWCHDRPPPQSVGFSTVGPSGPQLFILGETVGVATRSGLGGSRFSPASSLYVQTWASPVTSPTRVCLWNAWADPAGLRG